MIYLDIDLGHPAKRAALVAVTLGLGALLAFAVVANFIIGTLADDRIKARRDRLVSPLYHFPNSARLHARLAEAEMLERDRDLERARFHAERAVGLSPYDYRYRLTLASIKEALGDRPAAQQSLEEALRLAPGNMDARYRLANLLLRKGDLGRSLDEFRVALGARPLLLPATLDLVWRATSESIGAIDSISGQDSRSRLTLAQFLLKQSRVDEAVKVFASIDRASQLGQKETPAFINGLVGAGRADAARNIWADLVGSPDARAALISNGGFETVILKDFAQFDWTLTRSEYARLAIDAATARSGSRSLRVDFAGRDTTVLDAEIRQMAVVRPGASYTLACYYRSDALVTPEGPRLVVTDRSGNWIASSDPVAAGSSDWRRLAVDFVAPQADSKTATAVYISIKRKPKYSYDEPTSGTVWFDDFGIENSGSRIQDPGKKGNTGSGP